MNPALAQTTICRATMHFRRRLGSPQQSEGWYTLFKALKENFQLCSLFSSHPTLERLLKVWTTKRLGYDGGSSCCWAGPIRRSISIIRLLLWNCILRAPLLLLLRGALPNLNIMLSLLPPLSLLHWPSLARLLLPSPPRCHATAIPTAPYIIVGAVWFSSIAGG